MESVFEANRRTGRGVPGALPRQTVPITTLRSYRVGRARDTPKLRDRSADRGRRTTEVITPGMV